MFILSENVALNKPTWPHYPKALLYYYQKDGHFAVDGLKSDLSAYGNQCRLSWDKLSTAQWVVDLGRVLSIHHIFIQYRTDNVVWGNFIP